MSYFTRELNALPRDRDMLFPLVSNPAVTRYLGFKTHENVHDTERLLRRYRHGPGVWLGVFEGMPWAEQLVGVAGLEKQGHNVACSIYFSPEARGAGRRFALPWVRSIFRDDWTVQRIFAHCHVDNVPVQRVLERMGATREGRMRKFGMFPNIGPEPADCYLYSLLRGEAREP